jgi:Na+-driven multidrug efflux pump
MVLDPLLIFGVDGLFDGLGTRGAAIATWLSQGFVVLLFVWQLRKKNAILSHFPFLIRLQSKPTRRIFRIGLPVALMNLFFALINSTLARIASVYGGHLGISTQTTGGQIEGITWNTSQGFGTALSSFVAQNYAANRMDRAQKAYRYTLSVMFLLGIVVTISFLFFGEQIFGIIIPEYEARIAGGNYLFIIGFSQIFMMVELTTQGMFNGMGRTLPPAMVSIVFNLARIPLAVVLASRMGINGVWWAIAISSIIKGMILFVWLNLDFLRKK